MLKHQNRSAATLVGLGSLTGAVVIATRPIWTHTTPYLIRALDRRPQQRAMRVSWRPRMVLAWGGLRGSVSLAAALGLPTGFPERDLLIWLTLCTILATLVLRGLTLPALVRWLGIREDDHVQLEEIRARQAAAQAALRRIDDLRAEDWTRADGLDRLRALHEFRYRRATSSCTAATPARSPTRSCTR